MSMVVLGEHGLDDLECRESLTKVEAFCHERCLNATGDSVIISVVSYTAANSISGHFRLTELNLAALCEISNSLR